MPIIVTEEKLCDYLAVSRPYLQSCRKKGMPYISLGVRHIRYDISDVLEWLKEN